MMVLSILNMAVLMVRAGGNVVKPMLMAFERFASSSVNSFLDPSDCWKPTPTSGNSGFLALVQK